MVMQSTNSTNKHEV